MEIEQGEIAVEHSSSEQVSSRPNHELTPPSPAGVAGKTPTFPDHQSSDPEQLAFLLSLYEQMPMLVVRIRADGVVLQINPEATRVTGYRAEELLGHNFWAMMFPGRLFSQVPKFISAVDPSPLLRDMPMTLRTKCGTERTIAWTRFVLNSGPEGKTWVCIGSDLTDRLLESDKLGNVVVTGGNAGAVQDKDTGTLLSPLNDIGQSSEENLLKPVAGDFVQPLAISPPLLSIGADGGQAIQDVHEFLMQVETRIGALEQAFLQGQMGHVASLSDMLRNGAHACGLLAFSSAAQRLHSAANTGALDAVTMRVQELVGMAKGQQGGRLN